MFPCNVLSFSGALITGGDNITDKDHSVGLVVGVVGSLWKFVVRPGGRNPYGEEGPLNVKPVLRNGLEQLTNTECPAKSFGQGLSIPSESGWHLRVSRKFPRTQKRKRKQGPPS